MAGYLMWLQRSTVPAYMMILYWFVIQLFSGVGTLEAARTAEGGIAYFAHVGGFVTGWILIQLLRLYPPQEVLRV